MITKKQKVNLIKDAIEAIDHILNSSYEIIGKNATEEEDKSDLQVNKEIWISILQDIEK